MACRSVVSSAWAIGPNLSGANADADGEEISVVLLLGMRASPEYYPPHHATLYYIILCAVASDRLHPKQGSRWGEDYGGAIMGLGMTTLGADFYETRAKIKYGL